MITQLSPSARPKSRRGFTLIEILVVVGIIAILIGIGVFVGVQVQRSSAERSTKATLATLRLLMMDFEKSNREPPANSWLPALKSDPAAAGILKSLKGFNGTDVKDAYGGKIDYKPATTQTIGGVTTILQGGYFVSPGPDDTQGTADDIVSEPVVP